MQSNANLASKQQANKFNENDENCNIYYIIWALSLSFSLSLSLSYYEIYIFAMISYLNDMFRQCICKQNHKKHDIRMS